MANCFDHKCPDCGDEDHIDVAATVWVRLTENGSDLDLSECGDTEFTPRSLAVCRTCDYSGRLSSFEPEPEPLPIEDALQQALTALNTVPCFSVSSLESNSYVIASICERSIKAHAKQS